MMGPRIETRPSDDFVGLPGISAFGLEDDLGSERNLGRVGGHQEPVRQVTKVVLKDNLFYQLLEPADGLTRLTRYVGRRAP